MSVEDATVALKGILGISNSNTAPVPDDSKETKTPLKDSKKKNKKKQSKQTPKNTPKTSDTKSSSKKKNKNSSAVKKSHGKKNEDTKTEKGNYAWSSFQSPPDASNLPLPAFGSFNDGLKDSSASENKSSGLDLSDLADSDGRDDAKGINISSLAISNDSKKDDIDDTSLNPSNPDSKEEEIPKLPNNQSPKMEEPPEPSDPLAMLMNPSYGTAVKSTPPKNAYIQSPQYQPQQGYMQSPPPYGSFYQGPMSPQPSFVSIQVQVPPNLLPGRRMMVQANPNQPPISVVVPEGIQPGMYVPVTVPMHMYNIGPMMNPSLHPILPGQFHSGPSMAMNQAYQQNHQIIHGQFTSPQGERKPAPPPEGSWAAKVATSQQSK
jgi:hypothetical protein